MSQQFPYVQIDPSLGAAGTMPYLPITLEHQGNASSVQGLVDSGAALSVLPHDIGLQLGFTWNQRSIPIQLGGNLAAGEARAILVAATVAPFPPVQLAFAWANTNNVPILLGQMNFFFEFDVCFYRSRSTFEIAPKSTP